MDSNELKRLETAQQEMLNRFQKITQLVPGAIYQFQLRPDGSACMPYVSDAFHSLFRLNPADVRDDASKALMRAHPDDLENLMVSIHESARNMTPWQHEYRLKFDDGTERWVFGNSLPQREADGSILWHGFITDITKRRLMEEDLREREEIFRRLFENVNYPIALLKDGRFVDCNTAALELLGYCTKQELINRSPSETSPVYQTDGRSSVEKSAEMIAIAQRENFHRFEWMISKADGSAIPVEATLTPIILGGELIIHTLFHDISERKLAETSIRAEQETRASRAAVRKLAAHADKLREDERKLIARDVHDELGQVLSVLRMDISLLKDRSGINNAAMDGIERNMLALVDRVIRGVRNVASSLHPAPLDMESSPPSNGSARNLRCIAAFHAR
ncbi:MAG: PAS domain S-box protein [Gallionella sp.]|nr:PAS domain S-box protein [Gallionella sp.]